ncbi:MAG TPA: hypothetical protein VGA36_07035 [Nitriliruptorales bacterium]
MIGPLTPGDEATRLVRTDQGRFERVPADPLYAVQVLDDVVAIELDLVIVAIHRGRLTKALTLAYDGARKAVEAVMLGAGLRVGRGDGAHVAVTDFAEAEFSSTPAEARDARAFATARSVRHADEYPRPSDVPRSESELRVLTQACTRLVGHCRQRFQLDPRRDLVPTDANVVAYLTEDGQTASGGD